MAAEMLNRVLEKERESSSDEEKANAAADEIIGKAKSDAEKLLNETVVLCDEREKSEIQKSTEAARKSLEESEKSASKYADGLKKTSEAKFSEAVGLVKEIISR